MSDSSSGNGLPPALCALIERHQQKRAKTTADQSIARRLRDGVRQSGVQVSGLAFYVHDGAVSIYGTVQDQAAHDTLLATAASQPGVRRIVDHLRFPSAGTSGSSKPSL